MAITHIPTNHTPMMMEYRSPEGSFRIPTERDVLSGRGGFVNAHPGNVKYREIVQERRTEYSLESNKERKNEICRQVIDMVHAQGGHFLAKQEGVKGAAAWSVMSDERIVAKTNQALREGAPKIRQAHGQTSSSSHLGSKKRHRRATTATSTPEAPVVTNANRRPKRVRLQPQRPMPPPPPQPVYIEPQYSNSSTTEKIITPELVPVLPQEPAVPVVEGFFLDGNTPTTTTATPNADLCCAVSTGSAEHLYGEDEWAGDDLPVLQRSNSLVLSDISPHPNYLQEDFVNPFDYEEDEQQQEQSAPRGGFFSRRKSDSYGGIVSLVQNDMFNRSNPSALFSSTHDLLL